jgi:hypothetical protein
MKRSRLFTVLLGVPLLGTTTLSGTLPPTLDDAFQDLYSGRTYQLGFPPRPSANGFVGKTQKQVRDYYLGDPNGTNRTTFDLLSGAIDLAVDYRVTNYFGDLYQRDAQEIRLGIT